MINFTDIIKKSILAHGQFGDLTLVSIMMSLTTAFICAMIIFVVYKRFYKGIVYSPTFNTLLVLVSVVTAFVIMAIGSNIILSLGMVGALSIVRFRTVIKDPLDVGFLFFAIAVGIASGAGLYLLAVTATIFICLIYLFLLQSKPRSRPYLLVVKYGNSAGDAVLAALQAFKYSVKNRTCQSDSTELTLEIKIGGGDTGFVSQLASIEGVTSAILVEYPGEFGE
jgi:uncharacterized membrane protein YhiD involved in acid resistance